jgi:Protein of unknown function (DUF3570)
MRHKGAVVGVIKKFSGNPCRNDGIGLSLKALTTTALILPGLLQPPAHAAEDDEVDFQYSHYQEGKRDILESVIGAKNSANPIEVESLHGGAKVSLTDCIKFAFNYTQDTWGGATPIASAPVAFGGNLPIDDSSDDPNFLKAGASPLLSIGGKFDKDLVPYRQVLRDNQFVMIPDSRIVHTLAVASPETRKQGDFKLTYEWDNAALILGGGISVEDDYESRFGSINTRLDFNQKQTTLNMGISYTNSDINAITDHDIGSYGDRENFLEHIIKDGNKDTVIGIREDWGVNLGLTQTINQDSVMDVGMSFQRSTGLLENPYKFVEYFFIDPDQTPNKQGLIQATQKAYMEQRPDERNQWNWNLGYSQFIRPLDAALHFKYQFFHDDWGINAHTFESDWVQPLGAGLTLTPRIRYYSQEAADFYGPYFISFNKKPGRDENNAIFFDPALVQPYFSSDQRLSGFGTLSGGMTIAKQFAKGLSLEAGFEYYTHQGGLKLGGGGEQDFADFDYWVANAALKVNLAALGRGTLGSDGGNNHNHHASHANAPAGVMFTHTLDKAGDIMLGYRYMWNNQDGNMLHQDSAVSLASLQNKGCFSGQGNFNTCLAAPKSMAMHMHMLDLMVAPTDWLTLMLMPQFVNMDMSLRGTPTFDNLDGEVFGVRNNLTHHIANGHETGGIGDTGMYGLFKLWDKPNHKVNLGLGFSAPTGDVDIQLRRAHKKDGGFIHYNMQLGSGTWDFKPSLSYTGKANQLSWGAQVSGTKRMESRNKSGFALGDMFQGTAWGGYDLTNWLSASVRGVYTWQGRTKGEYPRNKIDFVPAPEAEACPNENFIIDDGNGNISIDQVGFNQCIQEIRNANKEGLKTAIYQDDGAFAGNRLSFEWLQPVLYPPNRLSTRPRRGVVVYLELWVLTGSFDGTEWNRVM